jgi:hypothetical protein
MRKGLRHELFIEEEVLKHKNLDTDDLSFPELVEDDLLQHLAFVSLASEERKYISLDELASMDKRGQHVVDEIRALEAKKQTLTQTLETELRCLETPGCSVEYPAHARAITYDKEKKHFLYKNKRGKLFTASFEDLLIDLDWHDEDDRVIEYVLQSDLFSDTEDLSKLRRYTIERYHHQIRELRDQQVALYEHALQVTGVFHQGLVEERSSARGILHVRNLARLGKCESFGIYAEMIAAGILKLCAFDPDASIHAELSDPFIDANQAIDLIITAAQVNAPVKHFGVQITATRSQNRLKEKQEKIEELQFVLHSDLNLDGMYVGNMNTTSDIIQRSVAYWCEGGRPPGGILRYIDDGYLKHNLEELLGPIFPQDIRDRLIARVLEQRRNVKVLQGNVISNVEPVRKKVETPVLSVMPTTPEFTSADQVARIDAFHEQTGETQWLEHMRPQVELLLQRVRGNQKYRGYDALRMSSLEKSILIRTTLQEISMNAEDQLRMLKRYFCIKSFRYLIGVASFNLSREEWMIYKYLQQEDATPVEMSVISADPTDPEYLLEHYEYLPYLLRLKNFLNEPDIEENFQKKIFITTFGFDREQLNHLTCVEQVQNVRLKIESTYTTLLSFSEAQLQVTLLTEVKGELLQLLNRCRDTVRQFESTLEYRKEAFLQKYGEAALLVRPDLFPNPPLGGAEVNRDLLRVGKLWMQMIADIGNLLREISVNQGLSHNDRSRMTIVKVKEWLDTHGDGITTIHDYKNFFIARGLRRTTLFKDGSGKAMEKLTSVEEYIKGVIGSKMLNEVE